MKLALKMSTPFVVFIGEKELLSDKLSIKMMETREQHDMLSFSEIMYLINSNTTSQTQKNDSKIKII
jgi:histidyl-tRNA synthetase